MSGDPGDPRRGSHRPMSEEIYDQEQQPLKKKKRRRNKLKNLALTQLALKKGKTHSSNSLGVLRELNSLDDEKEDTLPPLRRFDKIKSAPTKRFTISDLEKEKPEWLRNLAKNTMDLNGASIGVSDGVTGEGAKMALLRKLYNAKESDRIDYVLVYKQPSNPESRDEQNKAKKRARFEKMLQEDGFIVGYVKYEDVIYVTLQCTFPRLCKEAERVKLQLPLKNMDITEEEENFCSACLERTFGTDNDEVDFVSAPFEQGKLHLFDKCEKPDHFFRSSQRSLLTDHILKNTDMRKLPKTPYYYYRNSRDEDPDEDILAKQGLPYLLLKKVYLDAYILHDESADDFKESMEFGDTDNSRRASTTNYQPGAKYDRKIIDYYGDARHVLNNKWPSPYKFQPLWKVRNYFGEEIALYFAWVGLLVYTILIPMFIGLGVFGYGLFCSISGSCHEEYETSNSTLSTISPSNGVATTTSTNSTTPGSLQTLITGAMNILDVFKDAFDNDATVWYAIAICIWSTIFLEFWKRKNAVLAYEWDVNCFEDTEPDRPEYFGTAKRKDPITQEDIHYYPFSRKCLKYTISFVTFLFAVLLVCGVLLSVTIYRVVISVDYCDDWDKQSSAYCFVVTTVGSALLNAIAILILGKVYEMVAYKLNDWENHRTQTAYRNALIVKLFSFQFVNCYSSLYYIIFFREVTYTGGIAGIGSQYQDTCGGSCMSALSFQVIVLMVVKPLPKLLKDVILPWLKKKIKNCCGKNSSVDPEASKGKVDPRTLFLGKERIKPPLQDFTLGEYTEKVIQYGFAVLFAAAMPLGPLIIVGLNAIDRYIDGKRLLWMYRRPVANIAQDIGRWYEILLFLNVAGVITNACIITFESDWGRRNFVTDVEKLAAILVFEHLIFALKYALEIIIPDVPHRIRIAMRKEKHTVAKILETGAFLKENSFSVNALAKSTAVIMQDGLPGQHNKTGSSSRSYNDSLASLLANDDSSTDRLTTTQVVIDAGDVPDAGSLPRKRNKDHPTSAGNGHARRTTSNATSKPIKLTYEDDGDVVIH